MSFRSFERYCTGIRDTSVWGGEPEILALSRAYDVPIHVVQGELPHVVVHNPRGAPKEGDALDQERKVVRISYHRRLYGLGEVGTAIFRRTAYLSLPLTALQFIATEGIRKVGEEHFTNDTLSLHAKVGRAANKH
jgi:hypothetical protein